MPYSLGQSCPVKNCLHGSEDMRGLGSTVCLIERDLIARDKALSVSEFGEYLAKLCRDKNLIKV